ncbi:MAG TPA: HD domain-containing phosphohydrolase [Oxalicibacterium sp.]|uniref:HD domain-containing phosphohydrolase n=1 Tax=Oxalicibacterium sp. TaxID=2766525 RepID=UPI002C9D37D1|nr:HD domain-containing phosphohydrolase [Oxalicibacterium sp.]HWU98227.1 HD domain-containing phosphohydrolase [Oxalicibacterium sp.]
MTLNNQPQKTPSASTSLLAADLSEFFEGSPVPTFAIDSDHVITHWNRACEMISGLTAVEMVGTRNHWRLLYSYERPLLVDLIVSGTIEKNIDVLYRNKPRRSDVVKGTYLIEDYFPNLGENGRWLSFSASALCNPEGKIVGAIEVLQDITQQKNAELALQAAHDDLEKQVEARTAELKQANTGLTDANVRLKTSFLTTIKIFSNLIEMRAGRLAGHSRRVAELARRVAVRMNLSFNDTQDVFVAGLLHNIGKIGFSDEMLATSVSQMSVETLTIYQKFPVHGEQLLMPLEDMTSIARLIRSQQERFDGGGFPDHLSGDNIPTGARILAIASDYENLQNGTLVQRNLRADEAFNLIMRGESKRYDKAVVTAFREVINGITNPDDESHVELFTSQLKPGMVIARDLIGQDNFLLLSADHVLNERLIDKIITFERSWGVRMKIWVTIPARENVTSDEH